MERESVRPDMAAQRRGVWLVLSWEGGGREEQNEGKREGRREGGKEGGRKMEGRTEGGTEGGREGGRVQMSSLKLC